MTQRNKEQTTVDSADAMVALGLLLLGVSIWILWGFAAVLAYAGTVVLLFGLALAIQRGHRHG